MKDIIFIVTIILLLGMLIYTNNILTRATNLSEMYERKYDNLIISYEKHVEESGEMQKTYAKQIILYNDKSEINDETIGYQSKEIKSLESKLESLTEKYVDLIN